MRYEQRAYARVKFLELMAELYENAFEDFFQRLMCSRYSDFLDVRTAGSLGDMSADGLMLHSRKLYACYAPQTVKAPKIQKKFEGDLTGALAKRSGQFDTFVFVHNDRRGVHPEVAALLSQAAASNPSLHFEQMGSRRLWQECMQLDQVTARTNSDAARRATDCQPDMGQAEDLAGRARPYFAGIVRLVRAGIGRALQHGCR